jgi:hypothetical protein
MTETIEQAAERQWGNVHRTGVLGFIDGAKWQSSQPNPHRITYWQVSKLCRMYENGTVKLSRMVEILNEIAAGKHKERIEL